MQEHCNHTIQQYQKVKWEMKYAFMDTGANTVKLSLSPKDEDTRISLKKFRDEISLRTGVKHANHEEYRYHITFCYLIRKLHEEEEAELQEIVGQIGKLFENELGILTLQPPVLTFFDDMFEFKLKR